MVKERKMDHAADAKAQRNLQDWGSGYVWEIQKPSLDSQ